MDDLGGGAGWMGDDVTRRATEAATSAAGIAQEQVGAVAEIIKRQPIVVLLIGMVGAYLLGRLASSLRR